MHSDHNLLSHGVQQTSQDAPKTVSKANFLRNYKSMSAFFGSRTRNLGSSSKALSANRSSASQDDIYDQRGVLRSYPSFDSFTQNQAVTQIVNNHIHGSAIDESDITQSQAWSGWLFKQSQGLLGSWKPRWFEIVPPPQAEVGESSSTPLRCAVLIYQSENKGEQHLYVGDVRRERHFDSAPRIAFSIGMMLAGTDPHAARGRSGSAQRMQLMAPTDLEAVAFLSCMRRILQPERTWPTVRDAVHFPGKALRELE